jgi:hypothetical protein
LYSNSSAQTNSQFSGPDYPGPFFCAHFYRHTEIAIRQMAAAVLSIFMVVMGLIKQNVRVKKKSSKFMLFFIVGPNRTDQPKTKFYG